MNLLPRVRGAFFIPGREPSLLGREERIKNERPGRAGKEFIWLPPILGSPQAIPPSPQKFGKSPQGVNFEGFLYSNYSNLFTSFTVLTNMLVSKQ